jgi:hypothetical protein
MPAGDGFLSGWIMRWQTRKSGKLCGYANKVWLSPTGQKFRSMQSVQAFFEAATAEKRLTTQPKDPVVRVPRLLRSVVDRVEKASDLSYA